MSATETLTIRVPVADWTPSTYEARINIKAGTVEGYGVEGGSIDESPDFFLPLQLFFAVADAVAKATED